ncbi:hypothetical protein FBZ83_104420 [Azospirillum brasilense]|uniref:C2H2-type domain-containing protein n=1 Tax=Azospirillum brasilense TaxID=192 RepID=A0A560CJV9_AZOBR|nr:hypothetical protein [Azospirillum brasilense]TWA85148.1 hypothetical protein FBZ83_104420 [Azospirillum brasilense]
MPTLGWIVDDAVDFENAAHPLVVGAREPPAFACPFCAASFPSERRRSEHISLEHPIERPLLFVRGRLAPSSVTLRQRCAAGDLAVENCTRIRLRRNGEWEPVAAIDAALARIAASRDGHFQLELENGRRADGASAPARYTVSVLMAEAAELDAVDRLFLERLAADDVTVADVTRFGDALPRDRAAREYGSALADYVLGTLIKDQGRPSGVTLPFERFAEKYKSALAVLHELDRSVAATVSACIRFNLNQFEGDAVRSNVPVLDAAFAALAALARDQAALPTRPHCPGGRRIASCPIDRLTDEVLDAFEALGTHAPRHRRQALIERAESGLLSSQDRSKLLAFSAVFSVQAGDADLSRRALRMLANDGSFARWANRQLRELEP